MEQIFPFGTFRPEKYRTAFPDVPVLSEIFHWDDSQSRVPFTSRPDFPVNFFVNGTKLSGTYHFHLYTGLMGVGVGEKLHKHLCRGKCPLKKSCKGKPERTNSCTRWAAFSYWTRIAILPIILKTKQHLSKLMIAKGAWSQFWPPKKNSNNWLHSKKFLVQAIGHKNSSCELEVPVYLPLQRKLFKECKLPYLFD